MKLVNFQRIRSEAISDTSSDANGLQKVETPQRKTRFRLLKKTSSISSNPSITTIDEEDPSNDTDTCFPLLMFSDELQLEIFSFLDTQDIRRVMQVDHHCRELLSSASARNLWTSQCHRQWPWMPPSGRFFDDLNLKTKAVLSSPVKGGTAATVPYLPLLLSLSAKHKSIACSYPISIDESSVAEVEDVKILSDGNSKAVQFTGAVGHGEFCLRANQPLPRSEVLNKSKRKGIARRLRLKRSSGRHKKNSPMFRPFVSPFAGPEGSINVTPRLLSYFEVSILENREDAVSRTAPPPFQLGDDTTARPSHGEAVAVGLATQHFDLKRELPGWTESSYGCHGDNGGVYHASGDMIRRFAPTFGAGDTVGCGIDYHRRAIFFTLNGDFLGYAFENLSAKQMQEDFYPVVGVDTNCPLQCNFGCDKPFQFDLAGLMKGQQEAALEALATRV